MEARRRRRRRRVSLMDSRGLDGLYLLGICHMLAPLREREGGREREREGGRERKREREFIGIIHDGGESVRHLVVGEQELVEWRRGLHARSRNKQTQQNNQAQQSSCLTLHPDQAI
jgi:hypothetical protein